MTLRPGAAASATHNESSLEGVCWGKLTERSGGYVLGEEEFLVMRRTRLTKQFNMTGRQILEQREVPAPMLKLVAKV